MKMKTYLAPFLALMFIGLLVITGCQGLFEPPAKPAAEGTLVLSINGIESRTILPAAQLDKYVLKLYTGADATTDLYDQKDLRASTAIGLPADTYRVVIEGWVDGEIIADGEEQNIVITSGVTTVNIDLKAATTGDGTFSWDFSAYEEEGLTALGIEIYDIEEVGGPTDLYADTPEATGSIVLPAGVYSVKFTGTIGADTYTWLEILYIYKGLTSTYGTSAIVESEVFPTIPYVLPTPSSGYGFFYVDLNSWKNTPHNSLVTTLPKAVTEADGITAPFTIANQFVTFAFTQEQSDLLSWSKGNITITIKGSTVTGTGNFRYYLGDISGSTWNASSGSGEAAFSTFADADGISKTQTITSTTVPLKHFILQSRAVNNTITISSIKIEYNLGEEGFDVELDGSIYDSTVGGRPSTDSASFANDVLTAVFNGNRQWLNIPLTGDQVDAIMGDGTSANPGAATFYITVWGSADIGGKARYFLGDPDEGTTWNATGGSGEKSALLLVSGVGTTTRHTLNGGFSGTDITHFILQSGDDVTVSNVLTIDISRIRVDYDKKVIAAPEVPCACVDCAINGKTKTEARDAWLFCTCTDHAGDCADCEACLAIGPVPFDITAITGLPLYAAGDNSPVLTETNTLASVTGSTSTLFGVAINDTAVTDTTAAIVITYACIVWPTDKWANNQGQGGFDRAPVIIKKNTSWGNINDDPYQGFETGANKTLTLAAGALDADTSVIGFQHNNGDLPGGKYQVKIISVVNTP